MVEETLGHGLTPPVLTDYLGLSVGGTLSRSLGGFAYPVGSIPATRHDWRQHFGPQWPFLVAARHRYDPHGILTPGQRIFPHNR